MKGKLFIVYGGQFGSEGKGEITALICKRHKISLGVRIGGPNAGHTFYAVSHNQVMHKVVVQSVPTPAYFGAPSIIGPEGMVIPSLLQAELAKVVEVVGHPVPLYIDRFASVITDEHMQSEQELKGRIGSTGEGVGAATSDKIWRKPQLVVDSPANTDLLLNLFKDPDLYEVKVGADTPVIANKMLQHGYSALIEGTQGFGLSLHTGGFYPYCTSRECTPFALLAGTGINPDNAQSVEKVMVIRTYPIRVGGNSGPLANEISWEQLGRVLGKPIEPEKTTVTKKIRRIGVIDFELLKRAVLLTGPTCLAVTFLDYIFPDLYGRPKEDFYAHRGARSYIEDIENKLDLPVRFVATGPGSSFELD